MEEGDLEAIVGKLVAELKDCHRAKAHFLRTVFREAFETDPTENLVLETESGELAGFSFCGITHESDERHPVAVGYIGYSAAPTVFREHRSPENRRLLWEEALGSLGKRKTDVVRLAYGTSFSGTPTKEDDGIASALGFVRKEIPEGKELVAGGEGAPFYVDMGLPLSDWKEQATDPKYKIRRMEERDVRAVAEILDMSFDPIEPGNRGSSGVRARMGSGWVCEYEGRVAGCLFVMAYEPKGTVELRGQAVHPDYRRRGVATALDRFIINRLKSEGVGTVVAGVRNDNLAEYALLTGLGFDRKRVPDEGGWLFYKDMKSSS